MDCPNKNWIEKYGVKCKLENNKFKCKNLKKLKKKCSSCMYYHVIQCKNKYYALPCMYSCGEYTGLYYMCPNITKKLKKKYYKIIGYFKY
jgi:hypothetical protein